MIGAARTLLASHNLVTEWTVRTLRARYQQSLLGWLWAVVQPATQAVILAVIFTWVVPVDTGPTPYLMFSFVATAPWTFLSGALTDMTNSLVENMNLVNKVYFPREALPAATMLARLVDFAVALGFIFVLALYFQLPTLSLALAALPAIALVQMVLTAGLGLAGAALNVFVRDVRSVLALGLQLWFYATPVLYPIDKVPAALRPYFDVNPMTGIVEAYRAVLLRAEWPDQSFLVSAAVSALVLIIGYGLFKRVEFRFADVV